MAGYKVLIDDNFHYMDESERVEHAVFANADEAIAACKLIVDERLKQMMQPGITAAVLYDQYTGFGGHPSIMPVDPADAGVSFSAWQYARQRCEVLASARKPIVVPDDCEDVTADYAGTVIGIVGVKPMK